MTIKKRRIDIMHAHADIFLLIHKYATCCNSSGRLQTDACKYQPIDLLYAHKFFRHVTQTSPHTNITPFRNQIPLILSFLSTCALVFLPSSPPFLHSAPFQLSIPSLFPIPSSPTPHPHPSPRRILSLSLTNSTQLQMIAFCTYPLPALRQTPFSSPLRQTLRPPLSIPTRKSRTVHYPTPHFRRSPPPTLCKIFASFPSPSKLLAYAAAALILTATSTPLLASSGSLNCAPLRFSQSMLREDVNAPVKLRAQWDIKSLDCRTETFIMFSNDTDVVMDLWWVDYVGQEIYYASINPWTTHMQPSYATHPWVVRDHISQNPVLMLVAGSQPALAVVENASV